MTDALGIVRDEGTGVVTLTLNDPPMNALGLDVMDALEACIPQLASDRTVRAVVIEGAGEKHFSVGMNLMQIPAGVERAGSLDALLDQRLRVISGLENLSKPVIAAIRGYCLGGGLELALGCHLRVAAEDASIGLPELELGTLPAWGGTARLARCVGRTHALHLILRAQKISGVEALAIGLVNEVCPADSVCARAHALAQEVAAMPPIAVAGVLECVLAAHEEPLEASLARERKAVLRTIGTRDQQEGMMAFLEKRKPRFTGD